MPTWVTIIVLVAFVASTHIEARLWRAGRLSEQTLTRLIVGRFPVVCGALSIASGGDMPLVLAIIALAAVPGLLMYPTVLSFIEGLHPRRNSN